MEQLAEIGSDRKFALRGINAGGIRFLAACHYLVVLDDRQWKAGMPTPLKLTPAISASNGTRTTTLQRPARPDGMS
jgi:hypothetical protein